MIFIFLTVTLLTGTLLSLRSAELSLYYAIYYALCFISLKSFKYGNDFFLSFDKERTGFFSNRIKLAGQEISSNIEEDKQEDRFLNVFETHRVVKRKFLSWVLFLGGIWFFYYKNGLEMSVNSLVPVLSCFFIINSFFVGHLLVALLLNAILVTYNFSSDVPLFFYLFYALAFFSSLYLISKTLEEVLDDKLIKKKAGALLIISLLFFTLCVGFNTLLPDKLKSNEKKFELSNQEMGQLQEYLDKSRVDLGNILSNLPGVNRETLSPRVNSNLKEIEGLQNQLNKKDLSPAEREKILKDMSALMQNMQNLKTVFNQSLGGSQGSSLSQVEKDSFAKLKDDLDLTDEEKNNLASYINKTQDQLNALPASTQKEMMQNELDKLLKTMQEKNFTVKEQTEMTEAIEKISTTQNSIQENLKQEAIKAASISSEPDADIKNNMLEPLKKKEEPENKFFDKFQRILGIVCLAFVLILLQHLLRKKGIKTIEAANPEALKGMQDEWKKIRKLKLSPREEVIFHYNLFHESLQKIHYSEHEAPPSCRIYNDMKEINPDLEKPTFIITEVFAQCYYGNKDVNRDSLKLFRKALVKILKVYQLSY